MPACLRRRVALGANVAARTISYMSPRVPICSRCKTDLPIAANVKTGYIYLMNSRLVNVRLDEERIQKARKLRANGIPLSDLIREAIDQRYEKMAESSKPRDVETIMQDIYDRYPDPAGLRPRGYDVHKRAAAKKAILRRLRTEG